MPTVPRGTMELSMSSLLSLFHVEHFHGRTIVRFLLRGLPIWIASMLYSGCARKDGSLDSQPTEKKRLYGFTEAQ